MISIIVPVYGAESYLDECVLSLRRQTLTDIEIILVDDGSIDASGRICDHYASLDPRIRVIHKKSSGPSDARNEGLKVARGEFIGFADSDDFVASDMYAFLLDLLVKNNADVAICGHVQTTPKGTPYLHIPSRKVQVFESGDAIKHMLKIGQYESFVWNKLFRRELFDALRFPSGHLYEDLYTTYKALDHAKRIVYSREVKYFYRQRAGSIIHTAYSAKYFDYVQASAEICIFTHSKYPRAYRTARFAYYRARVFTYFRMLFFRPRMLFSQEARREELYKYVRAIISSLR